MTDNIVEILKNAKSITDIIAGNNSLDCIINSNNNGLENEHTVIFDKSGIIVKNNFTGIISKQKYDIKIISAIISNLNILVDQKYRKFMFFADRFFQNYYNDKYNLNILAIAFRYIDEKSSDDFIEICNKEKLINKNNYFLFLEFVCESGNIKIFKYLMLSYNKYFNNLNEDERSILTGGACFSGNTELVRILLQSNEFDFGFDALQGAILGKNFDIFEFLIENNISDINVLDNTAEKTILFDAIKNNYLYDIIVNRPEVINNMLDNHDSNIREIKPIIGEYLLSWPQLDIYKKSDNYRKTIIHYAAENKNSEVIKFLFERKPEIILYLNHKDQQGLTPLHLAAGNRNSEVIRFLLEKPGIEEVLNEKDGYGRTLFHCAAKNKNPEVIKLLLLIPEIRQGLNEKDNYNQTIFHYAAVNKNPEIIKLLLSIPEIRQNLNEKNEGGWTPLYSAIKNKNSDIVKLLLSQEDIKLENKEINKLNKYFNHDTEIMNLMNTYINTKLNIAIDNLSDDIQLKK